MSNRLLVDILLLLCKESVYTKTNLLFGAAYSIGHLFSTNIVLFFLGTAN